MWKFGLSFINTQVLVIALMVSGGWNIFQMVNTDVPEYTQMRHEIADEICWSIIDSIPNDIQLTKSTLIIPFVGDKARFLTDKLEVLIEGTGKINIVDNSLFGGVINNDIISVNTFEAALKTGEKNNADYVLYGEIFKFISDNNNATIKMDVKMLDVKSQGLIMSSHFENYPSLSDVKVKILSPWSRFIFWLLFTISSPLLLVEFVRKILSKRSNSANIILVFFFISMSILLALVLIGFNLTSFWIGALIFLGIVFSIYYNFWVCSYIDSLNKG